jgi:hypothetical protein
MFFGIKPGEKLTIFSTVVHVRQQRKNDVITYLVVTPLAAPSIIKHIPHCVDTIKAYYSNY